MTTASPNVLNDDLLVRADAAVEAASAFCERETYPLGVAMIRHLWRDGSANAVLDALATYQNSDGGIGNGLEVDIVAPVSNAFATRLAMQTILALRDQPQRDHPVVAGIHC